MSNSVRRRHLANGYEISRDLTPRLVSVDNLRPLGRETRKHPPRQIQKLARSLKEWGFVLPILVDPSDRVAAGWATVLAARTLGLRRVPAVTIADLSEAQLRALRLALNRIGEDSEWNPGELAMEFGEILQLDPGIDLSLTGFEMGEIDVAIDGTAVSDDASLDDLPDVDPTSAPITQIGDLWQLGPHRLLCDDATRPESFDRLMDGETAQMIFTDPPYNVPIRGHVSGRGKVQHTEFAQASGELSEAEFENFLRTFLAGAAAHCKNGAIAFICMDWRGLPILGSAASGVFNEQLNLCVWTKTNAGMGSLYRSQHEHVAVYKKGTAPHVNNVKLGAYGRYRTNVWDYPGLNSFGAKRDQQLALHPTVKPVALVKDAIQDCSNRNDIVIDPFIGSGTTIVAAERSGRRCFGIEIEPRYVDVTLRRFRKLTGIEPVHLEIRQDPH